MFKAIQKGRNTQRRGLDRPVVCAVLGRTSAGSTVGGHR